MNDPHEVLTLGRLRTLQVIAVAMMFGLIGLPCSPPKAECAPGWKNRASSWINCGALDSVRAGSVSDGPPAESCSRTRLRTVVTLPARTLPARTVGRSVCETTGPLFLIISFDVPT